MAAGVPQLVLPMGADRPYNALRLQRLGVAEVVSPTKWKPEILAAALRRLMTDSALLDRCRAFAERIRCQDASTAACEIIESVGAK
jgi:UDP:flavonoid glycosyltransferase YjiC (YdhE family)